MHMPSLLDLLGWKHSNVPHYYGDMVRRLFMIAGSIMLVTTPFFQDRLPVSAYVGLCAIIVLDVIAGLANPLIRWLGYVEAAIALCACMTFEYFAIRDFSVYDSLFWINQTLALLFFIALYYAVKTSRSAALKQQLGLPVTQENNGRTKPTE